ncbi:hypothetical protein BD626DRAFT_634065 [Schizophyllum amplum]|uniref:F-box domain-containing protein n=1 Tax=Schizophyllum amplum TaxID=97359 RepID=A0A550C0R9_9AGAR|nr:hypothetical protein BD626DRAFT_634065 [Auriculariopsis ampla]
MAGWLSGLMAGWSTTMVRAPRPVDDEDAASSDNENSSIRTTDKEASESCSGNPESRTEPGPRESNSKLALSEFPLDIMYEIFNHLQPEQLFSMSRTNKTLRDALTRKSARSIWRASFQNDKDIPRVPPDLNELQYARLLFDESCMFCSSQNGTNVAWAARVRCCDECLEKRFVNLEKLVDDNLLRFSIQASVPPYDVRPSHDGGSTPSTNSNRRPPTRLTSGRLKKPRGKLAALSEFPLDVMYEIFCYLHPAQLLAVSRTNKTLRGALLRKSARWIWKASFRNVQDIPEPPTDLTEPHYARLMYDKSCMYCLSPNAPYISWKARPSILQTLHEDRIHPDHRPWLALAAIGYIPRAEAARAAKDEIRGIRREFVYERLRELGWGEELEYEESRYCIDRDPLLRIPQRLTHRGWKTIEQELIAYVQALREGRLAKERTAMLHARYDKLAGVYDGYLSVKPLDRVYPVVGDVVTVDHIRAAIENTPVDHFMSCSTMRTLIDNIPQSWFVEWREKADAALVNILSKGLRQPATPADLSLASTHFFYVSSIDANSDVSAKVYPDVLADESVVARGDTSSWEALQRTGYRPWSPAQLLTTRFHLRLARALVKLAGLDPDTATREEMELHDPWFLSQSDSSDSQRSEAIRWPNLMNVLLEKDYIKKLYVLSEEDAAHCRWDFANIALGVKELGDSLVQCRLCAAVLRGQPMYDHLRSTYAWCGDHHHAALRDEVWGLPGARRDAIHEGEFCLVGAYTFPDFDSVSDMDSGSDEESEGRNTGTLTEVYTTTFIFQDEVAEAGL